jgi:hypothetical protein
MWEKDKLHGEAKLIYKDIGKTPLTVEFQMGLAKSESTSETIALDIWESYLHQNERKPKLEKLAEMKRLENYL